MKKLFIFLTLVGLFATTSFAQNAPVAVNDTINIDFEEQISINRARIINNDYDIDGNFLKIDTIFYNGLGLITGLYKNLSRVQYFYYTPPIGFFGKDSITYYITDYPVSDGFDTATITFM